MHPQNIIATLAAIRLAMADTAPTLFTFPEESGVNGTVTIDPAALARMPDMASYTFPEGSGINGTVSVDTCFLQEKMGQLAAGARGKVANETVSLMAGPSKDEARSATSFASSSACSRPPAFGMFSISPVSTDKYCLHSLCSRMLIFSRRRCRTSIFFLLFVTDRRE